MQIKKISINHFIKMRKEFLIAQHENKELFLNIKREKGAKHKKFLSFVQFNAPLRVCVITGKF